MKVRHAKAAPSRLAHELRDFTHTQRLLANAPLMHRLDGLVGLYSRGGQWWKYRHVKSDGRTIPLAKVAPKGRALTRALADVERLMWDPQLAAILTWTAGPVSNPKVRAVGGIRPWLEALAEIRRHAEKIARLKSNRRRGRPPDPWRDLFCRGIARALQDFDKPVKISDGGLFAHVLRAAFAAAGEDPPDDLFRLVKRAADSLQK